MTTPQDPNAQPGAALAPNPDAVNEFHRYSDVDNSPDSHHHTIGIDPNQASPGDHSHDGRNSKTLTAYSLTGHLHDDRYFTEAESDARFAPREHDTFHDDRFSLTTHTHDAFTLRTAHRNEANAGVATPLRAGAWEIPPITGSGFPGGDTWHHFMHMRHTNDGNNYAAQIATTFFGDTDNIWWRKIDNGVGRPWRRFVQGDWNNPGEIASNSYHWAHQGTAQRTRIGELPNGAGIYTPDVQQQFYTEGGRGWRWSTGNITKMSLNDRDGKLTVGGDRNVGALDWENSVLEIRDVFVPRIAFHQPGQVASSIGQFDNSEAFRTYNNPGNGYQDFRAAGLYDFDRRVSVEGHGHSHGHNDLFDTSGRRLAGAGANRGIWHNGGYLHVDSDFGAQHRNVNDTAWVDSQALNHVNMSSRSLKRDIKPLDTSPVGGKPARDLVKTLIPVRYFWADGTVDSAENVGFIAEDVQSIFPEAVSKPRNYDTIGLKTGALIAILAQAFKEEMIENQKLRDRVTRLETKVGP